MGIVFNRKCTGYKWCVLTLANGKTICEGTENLKKAPPTKYNKEQAEGGSTTQIFISGVCRVS